MTYKEFLIYIYKNNPQMGFKIKNISNFGIRFYIEKGIDKKDIIVILDKYYVSNQIENEIIDRSMEENN